MFLYFIIFLAVLSLGAIILPKNLKFLSSLLVVLVGFGSIAITQGDNLSKFFSLLVSLCALCVVIYSKGYLQTRKDNLSSLSLHYLSMSFLYISLLMVVNFSGGYSFLFAWELMSITSFFLMLLEADNAKTRRTALNYLVFMHLGFILLLSGFSLLDNAGCDFGFGGIAKYCQENNPTPFFILMLLGFGLKAGMFPLHVWMPESYEQSPSYVSSFMSGAVSKMGLYGIIRVLIEINTELYIIGIILLVFGALTGIWGVLCCALQSSLKRALAYSSIENMGIMFLMLSAMTLGRYFHNDVLALCAMSACLVHALSHSSLKSLLFFSSGNVITSLGGEMKIDKMGGVLRRMPISSVLFLIGALAICALPPLSGFISEFILYYGLLDSIALGGDTVILPLIVMFVLALIGGLAIFAFSKIFSVVFLGVERSECVEEASEVNSLRLVACAIPVSVIVLIGLVPALFYNGFTSLSASVLDLDLGVMPSLDNNLWMISKAICIFLVVCLVLYAIKWWLLRGKTITKTPTWGCGFTKVNERMQYTSESFASDLHSMLPHTKDPDSKAQVPKDELFAQSHSFISEHSDKVDTIMKSWWVELIRMTNSKVMKIRTGKVNYQVLYALVFLVLILSLSLLKLI